MAPPHTRGWTPQLKEPRGKVVGSPAHAGMDPLTATDGHKLIGLPRTRGDGPAQPANGKTSAWAPPHTRGWTRRAYSAGGQPSGSPAHAGMDPLLPHPTSRTNRLPRTRGDGPPTKSPKRLKPTAPPHTRGWTRLRPFLRPADRGSPAHAGMDPDPNVRNVAFVRLPRTRGDGPLTKSPKRLKPTAPPHTRGWTLSTSHHRIRSGGSPAHAGMDR